MNKLKSDLEDTQIELKKSEANKRSQAEDFANKENLLNTRYDMLRNYSNKEIRNLNDKMDELDSKLDNDENIIKDLNSTIKKLESNKKDLQDRLNNKEDELANEKQLAKEKIEDLRQKLNDALRDMDNLKADFHRTNADKAKRAEELVAKEKILRFKFTVLKKANDDKIDRLNKLIDQLRNKSDSDNIDIKVLKEKLNNA